MKRPIAVLLILCAFLLSACTQAQVLPGEVQARVIFFEAGKADAILIETSQGAVMIDTGLRDDAEELAEQLSALGVARLDALIITHFDKDHIGGAPRILGEMPVDIVYEPDYEKDSKTYHRYKDALEEAGTNTVTLSQNIGFDLAGAHYEIDVANEGYYGEDEENDFSLVVRMTVGAARAFFAGDAEGARIMELLGEGDLASGLLKVPHHGRYEKQSPLFFDAVGAKYAVVTSSDDEPEERETMLALKAAGTEAFLTRQGRVIASTDGKDWAITQS